MRREKKRVSEREKAVTKRLTDRQRKREEGVKDENGGRGVEQERIERER